MSAKTGNNFFFLFFFFTFFFIFSFFFFFFWQQIIYLSVDDPEWIELPFVGKLDGPLKCLIVIIILMTGFASGLKSLDLSISVVCF